MAMKVLSVGPVADVTGDGEVVVNRRWTTSWRGEVALLEEGRRAVVARGRLHDIHESVGGFCCEGGDPRPGMFHLRVVDVVALRRPVPMAPRTGMPALDWRDESDVRQS